MGRLKALPSRLSTLPMRIGFGSKPAETEDKHRLKVTPWRSWYNLKRWADLRIATFIRDLFTCRMCGKLHVSASTLTCDHVKPHRGDPVLFWDPDNLQSLCTSPCHVKHKQAEEHRASIGPT